MASEIFDSILEHDNGKVMAEKLPRMHSETMVDQDSYRETFALWVENIQLTKVSGSDHSGAFRIGRRGQVKMQYTMGEVVMSARQGCLQHS